MSAPGDVLSLSGCPLPLGLAVSGGSDSLALLHKCTDLHPANQLRVATVDHGLRAEARQEAEQVGRICESLGVQYSILRVSLPYGGDLQARARAARYTALSDWAQREKLAAVALGHTQDDQAETLLIRLSRGSGIDGLAGMPSQFEREGVTYVRPLLRDTRHALRAYLRDKSVTWCDDPSNEDDRFTRVRARKLLPDLDAFGITSERLADTGRWMQAGVEVLEGAADTWITEHATAEWGDAILDPQALRRAPIDTAARVLARILQNITSAPYRPRFTALERLIAEGQGTLHGCLAYAHKGKLRLTREPRAVVPTSMPWDGRWQMSGQLGEEQTVRPLGEEGLKQLKDWRDTALLPRRSLLATPAVWEGETLIAAPLAVPHQDWTVSVSNPLRALGQKV